MSADDMDRIFEISVNKIEHSKSRKVYGKSTMLHRTLLVNTVLNRVRNSERTLLHQPSSSKKIFTPVKCPCWGHVFGSEKFQKSQPESGFPPELFFKKSSIFSNISYRGVSWSDCLPRGVYI